MFVELKRLFSLRTKLIVNIFKTPRNRKNLSFVFLSGSFFFLFIYFLFKNVFSFLARIPVIGALVGEKILDLSLMGILFFLCLSTIVFCFAVFEKDQEISFLLKFPLKEESIFIMKIIEIIFYSSWVPSLFLIPFIIAYITTFKINKFLLFFLPINILLFILISCLIGIIIFYIFLKYFPFPKREIFLISFSLIFFLSIFLYIKITNPQIFQVFDAKTLKEATEILSKARVLSPFIMPSRWLVEYILGVKNILITTLLFFSTFLFLSNITISIPFREIIYTGKLRGNKKGSRKYKTVIWDLFIKSVTRNSSQLMQLIFYTTLVIVYIVAIRGKGIALKLPIWHLFLAYANFTFIGYLLLTFSVRFIYPVPSIEEKNIKLLILSPSNLFKILILQFLPLFMLTFLLGVISFIITHFSLKLKVAIKTEHILILGIMIISFLISYLSFIFGFLFPYYGEKNIARIASSAGGLILTIFLIFYLLLSTYILMQPDLYFIKHKTTISPLIFFVIFLIFSSGILYFFNHIFVKKLKNIEF